MEFPGRKHHRIQGIHEVVYGNHDRLAPLSTETWAEIMIRSVCQGFADVVMFVEAGFCKEFTEGECVNRAMCLEAGCYWDEEDAGSDCDDYYNDYDNDYGDYGDTWGNNDFGNHRNNRNSASSNKHCLGKIQYT